jgi:hypothetical protein
MRNAVATLLLGIAMSSSAREVFVSPTGDDGAMGTRKAPLRTLAKAVENVQPGDTITVRGGVYREAVLLEGVKGTEGKPVRLQAAKGESVVLDGTEPVAGPWEQWQKGIWRTRLKADSQIQQLFAGKRMLNEARWPNASFSQLWDVKRWAKSTKGSRKDLMICTELAKTNVDWTGAVAVLNVGHQYKTWTRTVLAHKPGSDRFTYDLAERLGDGRDDGRSWADDRFFLVGKLAALDAPGEWFHDVAGGWLYLYPETAADPAKLDIRRKARVYGIQARNCAFLQVSGLDFFACTVNLNGCEDSLIEDGKALYPTYTRHYGDSFPKGKRKPMPFTGMIGNRNTVRRLGIAYANGFGILVRGVKNTVEDCVARDVNWWGNFAYGGISINGGKPEEGGGNVVQRCTVSHCGNVGILYYSPGADIGYNHVHHTGLTCHDIAAVHVGGRSARGSVTHHNWIHHSSGLGMRGDDQTRELTLHHNVVWNCRRGIAIKGDRNLVYNNTVLVDPASATSTGSLIVPKRAEPKKWWTRDPVLAVQNDHSTVVNNATYGITSRSQSTDMKGTTTFGNVLLPKDLNRVFQQATPADFAKLTFDLRPRPGTPLIDAGKPVPGVRHSGTPPDAGAYEAGAKPWRAGAGWTYDPLPGVVPVPFHRGYAPSVPMHRDLLGSELSDEAKVALVALHKSLWLKDRRLQRRVQAINARTAFPKSSAEYKKHQKIVSQAHQIVAREFEAEAPKVVPEAERVLLKKLLVR